MDSAGTSGGVGENELLTGSELLCFVQCGCWIWVQTLGLADRVAGWGGEGAGMSVV